MKYVIFSDVHSNLEAFQAMLEVCRREEAEKFICLGDIVGYNASPKECLHLLWSLDLIAMVRGNHDEYVALDDMEMPGVNPNARLAVIWTRSQLSAEERGWLGELPLRSTLPGLPITIVHATLDSPEQWGYIFDAHHAVDNFSYQFTQLCFCGHSHVPVAFCKKPVASMRERSVDEILQWNVLAGEDGTPEPEDFSRAEALPVEILTGYKYLFNTADTRCWELIPAEISLAVLPMPEDGQLQIILPAYNADSTKIDFSLLKTDKPVIVYINAPSLKALRYYVFYL